MTVDARDLLLSAALILACDDTGQRPSPDTSSAVTERVTPAPVLASEPAGSRDALATYVERKQFLSAVDTTMFPQEPVCGSGAAMPQRYVGFVNPRVLGVTVDSSDPKGVWASGLAEVSRLFTASREPTWSARFEPKLDTLRFKLLNPSPARDSSLVRDSSSARDSSSTWVVCRQPADSEYPATFDRARRRGVGRGNWQPATVTLEAVRAFADSMEAARTGTPWRRNPPPTVHFVIPGACPGEGCSFGEWLACGTLPIRSAERTDAPVVFTLQRGDRFTAVTGNVHVEQAGMVVFRDTLRVDDTEYGLPLFFTPADTLYPLHYEGEGFGLWYLHGRQLRGEFFFPDASPVLMEPDPRFVVVRRLQNRWWVHVRKRQGQLGWLDADALHSSLVGTAPHYEESPLRCPD